MQRFFFPHIPLVPIQSIREDAFIHQISRVLRSVTGDRIILFNGDGREYLYEITSIAKKEVQLSLVESYQNTADPTKCIRLYQALPNKYEKIEYILQKWVEVGVSEFIFFLADRSQKLIINERKIARFEEIASEALEQCGGNRMPQIRFEMQKKIPIPDNGDIFVLHTKSEKSKTLWEIVNVGNAHVNIFVGPEGGWSADEIIFFQKSTATFVYLGDRILRTETAGQAIIFFLLQK